MQVLLDRLGLFGNSLRIKALVKPIAPWLFISFLSAWSLSEGQIFFAGLILASGGYLIMSSRMQTKELLFLCRMANHFEIRSCLPNRIRWYDPARFSLPHFLKKKESLHGHIIEILGIKVIEKHVDTLSIRRQVLCHRDEYGYFNDKQWEKEKSGFISRVITNEILSEVDHPQLRKDLLKSKAYEQIVLGNAPQCQEWRRWIDTLADARTTHSKSKFDSKMTGHQYEHYLATKFISYGWHAFVTPGSGDHGAYIIVSRADHKIAVQCKLYSKPVGNKSVQEAYSAKDYYDCNQAWVVTNSLFTPAARQAAGKLGVTLLHHDHIESALAKL